MSWVATFYLWTGKQRPMAIPLRRLSSSSSCLLHVQTYHLQYNLTDFTGLTIPRRRKLAVWSQLFVSDLSRALSRILAPLAMRLAGICVVCDTIIWLSICFAFASPMLLSRFYEAYLDYIIINFLQEKVENFRLAIDMRARLLFVILCGNVSVGESFLYF
jgi:hypothetical protein